jgi:hypothetical protein
MRWDGRRLIVGLGEYEAVQALIARWRGWYKKNWSVLSPYDGGPFEHELRGFVDSRVIDEIVGPTRKDAMVLWPWRPDGYRLPVVGVRQDPVDWQWEAYCDPLHTDYGAIEFFALTMKAKDDRGACIANLHLLPPDCDAERLCVEFRHCYEVLQDRILRDARGGAK